MKIAPKNYKSQREIKINKGHILCALETYLYSIRMINFEDVIIDLQIPSSTETFKITIGELDD